MTKLVINNNLNIYKHSFVVLVVVVVVVVVVTLEQLIPTSSLWSHILIPPPRLIAQSNILVSLPELHWTRSIQILPVPFMGGSKIWIISVIIISATNNYYWNKLSLKFHCKTKMAINNAIEEGNNDGYPWH